MQGGHFVYMENISTLQSVDHRVNENIEVAIALAKRNYSNAMDLKSDDYSEIETWVLIKKILSSKGTKILKLRWVYGYDQKEMTRIYKCSQNNISLLCKAIQKKLRLFFEREKIGIA